MTFKFQRTGQNSQENMEVFCRDSHYVDNYVLGEVPQNEVI